MASNHLSGLSDSQLIAQISGDAWTDEVVELISRFKEEKHNHHEMERIYSAHIQAMSEALDKSQKALFECIDFVSCHDIEADWLIEMSQTAIDSIERLNQEPDV